MRFYYGQLTYLSLYLCKLANDSYFIDWPLNYALQKGCYL